MTTVETTSIDLLSRTETAIAALPEVDVTPDIACELLTALDGIEHRAKEAKAQLKAFLLQWMPANNVKELTIGDVVHFVGHPKKVKDNAVGKTVLALMDAAAGDMNTFTDCLSVNAVKPSEAKKLLGDKFDQYFTTTYGSKLEMQSLNKKFLK